MRQSSIIILLYLVGCHSMQNQDSNDLSQPYANVTLAIADYFSSACIFLLLRSKNQDKAHLFNIAKHISSVYGKLSTVATISEYFNILNKTPDLDLCYMPLHVIIDNGDNHRVREAISMHSNFIRGPEQPSGGIWLIFLKSFDESFINDYFRDITTPFDSEIIAAFVNNNQIQLKEIYRVADNFPLRQPYFGYWSLNAGLKSPKNPMLHGRRSDLEGLELQVGFVDIPPMTMKKTRGKKKTVRGFMADIWDVIQTAINSSSIYIESDELGAKHKDTWTGLLAELKYDRIDIAVSPFILTRDRVDIIEFSYPLMETNFQVFFQHPGSNADDEGFLLPFENDVWLTTGAWLLIGSLFFYLSCRINDSSLLTDDKNFTPPKSLFVMFAALCGQASDEMPKKIPSRIIFLFTFIIATVLIPSYSASLISYLTIMQPEIPFTNMKEFYENQEYKMLVRNGSYEYDLFEDGSHLDPYISKIFERDLKEKTKLPKTNRQGISMLCQDKFNAFFGTEASIEWNLIKNEETLEKLNCVITKMIKDAGKISIGLGFPTDSSYKALINHKIRNLKSLGIIDRIRKKYWVKYEKNNQEWNPVDVQNIRMIFVVWGVGMIVASIIFMIEFILRSKLEPTYDLSNERRFSFPQPSYFPTRSHDLRILRKYLRNKREHQEKV